MRENLYNYNNRLVYLSVDKILPNPYQTRSCFDKESIDDLAKSIKNYGVIEPIGVRLINKRVYELIYGERRLMACKLAGIDSIPAILTEVGDREAAALTVEENIHRQNLHYVEMADAVNIMYSGFGYNEDEIGQILSIESESVDKYLKLNQFSREVKKKLMKCGIDEEKAEIILKSKNSELQKNIIDKVCEFNLNSDKTEIIVDSAIKEQAVGKAERGQRELKRKIGDLRLFTSALKQAVSLMNESGVKSDYEIERDEDRYKISISINL